MKTGICRTACLLTALATLLTAPAASAYNAGGRKWTLDRTVLMNLSLGGARPLQDGFASFNESAADALSQWNRYLAHLQFSWLLNSSLPPASSDESNSAFFSSTVFGEAFGTNVLAVTVTSTRSTTLSTESDTVFNNAINWDSYRGPEQDYNGPEDFHRVAIHEFGHALGLDHPDDIKQHVSAIMNSTVSNVETLQPDDIAGVQSLYGSGPAYRTIPTSTNLVNLSTRGWVGTGDQVLIGGLILDGSQATTVIVRALGRSVSAYGVASPLNDPLIELHDANGSIIAQNDDWIESADAQTIASYHLDPSNSIESAVLATLKPGSYTAIVRSFDNGDGDVTGVGLVEAYDLHANTGGRARNISTRGEVLTGDNVLIAGFIIGGSQPKEVIVRGLGPSVADKGVTGALADPWIEVHDSTGRVIASNDNWQSDPNAARVQALGLAPNHPVESALDLTLSPGSYTVIMRGVNDSTGVGLAEVYDTSASP